jgi:hypothetical protein
LSDDGWMLFAAAEALLDGDETKARELLLRALKLGEVRGRGVYLPDQKTWDDGCLRNDFEPEAIPADRWSTWEFLPVYEEQLSGQMRALQWLVPLGTPPDPVCRGYADVQLSRPDVERLARAASLGAIWISLLCSDGDSEPSGRAGVRAKSYFDDLRWPLRHALNWIACRKIEALTLTPDELRSRRWQALMYKGDATGVASVNPAFELLTAFKAGKLRAIGPDHNQLPPEFWDDQSFDPKTWRNVRCRRDDMLRLWPASEAMPNDEASCEGLPSSEPGASDVPGESGALPRHVEARGKDRGSDGNQPPLSGDLPPQTRARAPSLTKRLAAELPRMYPGGRPAKSVEEIRRDLEKRPEIGNFKQRTLERAIKHAWPSD